MKRRFFIGIVHKANKLFSLNVWVNIVWESCKFQLKVSRKFATFISWSGKWKVYSSACSLLCAFRSKIIICEILTCSDVKTIYQNALAERSQPDPISFINDVTTSQIKPHLASIAKAVVSYIHSKALGTIPAGVNQAWLYARSNILGVASNFLYTYNEQQTSASYRNFNEEEFKQFFMDLYNLIGTRTQTVYATYSRMAAVESALYDGYLANHTQMMAPFKKQIQNKWTKACWNETNQAYLKTAMDDAAGNAYTVANKNVLTLTSLVTLWTGHAGIVQNLAASVINSCVTSSDVGTCLTQLVSISSRSWRSSAVNVYILDRFLRLN